MPNLSVIIPYAQEYPQIEFTIRAVHENLYNIDHEIVVVDNLCDTLKNQLIQKNITIDDGHDHICNDKQKNSRIYTYSRTSCRKWLRYLKYDKELSHWQCKNFAIQNSDSKFILFIDAHCIPSNGSLYNMFSFYNNTFQKSNASIHLPLTYHILDEQKLIYKFIYDKSQGKCEYSFTNLPVGKTNSVFEIKCMSSCGMLCARDLFNKIGLFPTTGIYSGGEHFLNFCMAILGYKKYIYNIGSAALHHHGYKRDYNYTYDTYQYNRAVANYMFGGEEWLSLYINNLKVIDTYKSNLYDKIITNDSNCRQRQIIKSQQIISLEDWVLLNENVI